MFKYIFLFIALLAHWRASAQSSSTVIGARAEGMGNAISCVSDTWSVFANPAGIAGIRTAECVFTYDAVPSFPSFNRMAAAIALPTTFGTFGGGIYRFGDDLYNEHVLSAAYANTFGLASLGIKGNVVQYSVAGFGSKHILTLNMGGIAQLTPWLRVGAYIININQPSLESGQHVPTILQCGVQVFPTDKCLVALEVEKDLDYKPTLKTGVEYELNKKITLRTGINLFPNAAFGGIGFKQNRFQFDYAYAYTMTISASHQASVRYQIKKQ